MRRDWHRLDSSGTLHQRCHIHDEQRQQDQSFGFLFLWLKKPVGDSSPTGLSVHTLTHTHQNGQAFGSFGSAFADCADPAAPAAGSAAPTASASIFV